MMPPVQPGMPMGYDTSHWQASQQPPTGPSPRSEYAPWSVPPADFSTGAHNAWGGSQLPRSANESYLPYNPGGFVGQQDPPPMIPPRSQLPGSASDWHPSRGSYSHPGQSTNGSYPSRPPGFSCEPKPRPMHAASPYQGPASVYDTLGPYP